MTDIRGNLISFFFHALGFGALGISASLTPERPSAVPVMEIVTLERPSPPLPIPMAMPQPEPRTPEPMPIMSPQVPKPAPRPEPHSAAAMPPITTVVASTLEPEPENGMAPVTRGIPTQRLQSQDSSHAFSGSTGEQGLKGRLVSVTRLSRMPKIRVAAKPEYNLDMKKHRVSGKVKARVLVDIDGRVANVHILEDLGYGTREASVSAIKKMEFEPGRSDDAPVAVWIPFTFKFELQE